MGTVIDGRITWAVEHMEDNLAGALSVPELAARVRLSPSRFRDLFSAHTGVAPAQYLRQLRLRRARVLIERTFLSVKEVMALVGYNDPSHFSRDFRRFHGMAPSRLRGSEITTPLPQAPGASEEPPVPQRIRPPRARDPGRQCA